MNRYRLEAAIAATVLACAIGNATADLNDSVTERRLSVANAATSLVLPREDWILGREQRRPDDGAVYYMLSSERRKVHFSVFIEKTAICNSAESCLKMALKNPQYKDAIDLRESVEGPFRVAQFHLDQPQGVPLKQAHVMASAYIEGVWYDVHLSKAAKDRPDIADLLDVLRQVAIR